MQQATAQAHAVASEEFDTTVSQPLVTEERPVQLAGTGAWSSARQQQGAGNPDTVTLLAAVAAASSQEADAPCSTIHSLDAAVAPQAVKKGLQSFSSHDPSHPQPHHGHTTSHLSSYQSPGGEDPSMASQEAAPMFLQQPVSSKDTCWGFMPSHPGALLPFQLDHLGTMTAGDSSTVGAVGLLEAAAGMSKDADGGTTGVCSNNVPASRPAWLCQVTAAQSAAASSSAACVAQHPVTAWRDVGAGWHCWQQSHTSPASVTPVWGMTGAVGSKSWSSTRMRLSPGLRSTNKLFAGTPSAHSSPGVPGGVQTTKDVVGAQPQVPRTASRHVAACTAGTAAFKCVSRSGAGRVGHFSTAATPSDQPGPGQFRPQHTAVDKHVQGVSFAAASKHQPETCSTTAGQDAGQQHRLQLGNTAPQDTTVSKGKHASQQDGTPPKAARRASACMPRCSPRSEAAALGSRGQQQGAPGSGTRGTCKQQPQGTSAFKATSRDQLAARTAQRSCEAAKCDHRQLMTQMGPTAVHASQSSTRVTAAKALEFSKQIPRSQYSAGPSQASHTTLGPGIYFRSGSLPGSWTGKALHAGHEPGASAPDFARTSSRPDFLSSRGQSRCQSARQAGTLLDYVRHGHCRPATAGEPGLWLQGTTACNPTNLPTSAGTPAAVQGLPASDRHNQQPQCAPFHAAASCVGGSTCDDTKRPSSAALDYARCQWGTLLVSPAALQSDTWMTDHESSGRTLDTTSCPQSQQVQQQQSLVQSRQQHQLSSKQRPGSVGQHDAASWQVKARPWSAGPLLGVSAASSRCSRRDRGCHGHDAPRQPRSAKACGAAGQPALQNLGCMVKEMGHHDCETCCQQSNKTDFASQVKGGKFSVCSRDAAARPGGSCGGELLYEPKPEVQGHMRRTPQWSLPPNRVENSKKWARLAAQASLQ